MASGSDRDRLEQDDVVRDLVSDPSEVPEVRMFIGLLGSGARDGYARLYFSTELKDYLDVRDDDVLLTRSLKSPENPLGGTAIWVRAAADLEVTRRASEEAEQGFLTGEITARFLQGATASGVAIGGVRVGGGGLKSVPPVESCVPALCLPPPPPPPPPGNTAVCTLATNCGVPLVVF
jgi:hypothetical protein